MAAIEANIFCGLIVSTVLSIPLNSQAITIEEVPNPQSSGKEWVTDMADILSIETEAELNRLITNLEQANGTEIAVVTVPETSPANSPKTFTTQLFNHWGIGKAESDNGILFLISTADRRVEIETGYGMEEILPDARIGNIIDTEITPQYKQGDYDRGTLNGTEALIGAIDLPAKIPTENVPTSSSGGNWNILAILAGIGFTSVAGGLFWWRKSRYRVFINPRRAIATLNRDDSRDVCCAKCKKPMEKVDNVELTKVQQVAKKTGSISYRGYKCSSCSNSSQPYSLVAYYSHSSRYQECPDCQELTVTRTGEVLEPPTYTSKGKTIVRDTCHCCNYLQEEIEITSPLRRHNPNNRSRTSGGSGSSYYGGGSGSSSGGGGGFGGGSSGGGGAGGSW